MEFDPYAELEVSPVASDEVIQAAYRRLAKKYHPDSGESPDGARMSRINQAYAVLSDPSSRRQYDRRDTAQSDESDHRVRDLLIQASVAAASGRWGPVRSLAASVLRIDRRNTEALLFVAEAALAQEAWVELKSASNAILELTPNSRDGLIYAAHASAELGDWLAARSFAATVLVTDPTHTEALDLWDEAVARLG